MPQLGLGSLLQDVVHNGLVHGARLGHGDLKGETHLRNGGQNPFSPPCTAELIGRCALVVVFDQVFDCTAPQRVSLPGLDRGNLQAHGW